MLVTPQNTYYLHSEVFGKCQFKRKIPAFTNDISSINLTLTKHSAEDFLNQSLNDYTHFYTYLKYNNGYYLRCARVNDVLKELGAERVDNGNIDVIQIFLLKKELIQSANNIYCLLTRDSDDEGYSFLVLDSVFV